MCWSYMIRKCRQHRNLVSKIQWQTVDAQIHALQLSFSDEVFQRGAALLIQKWSDDSSMMKFSDYFLDLWITKLLTGKARSNATHPINKFLFYRYEGSVFTKPSTNNGCESMNAIIKQKYTLRNRLHLSAFLQKVEQMLNDWSEASITTPVAPSSHISPDNEVRAHQWSLRTNRSEILHWLNAFYVVPSSNLSMTRLTWLNLYRSGQWTSFDEFALWQNSCWLVAPLVSCTCPIDLKEFTCKHSVGLAILQGIYDVTDKIRCEPLGKRKNKGRPKKVRTTLFH